jgi:hypothetical protein
MTAPIVAACPRCGVELEFHGEVTLIGFVRADSDPEGKVRADLMLDCDACEARFNAFVALSDFEPIEEGTT